MGYQVSFTYHGKKEKAYDMENTKAFSKHVGKENEDTPLDQVAALIKTQFARRDILVVDCEVHEYTKKKIKVKDIKGGIQLKDQKFIFDDLKSDLTTSAADAETPQLQPHEVMRPQQAAPMVMPHQGHPNRVLRMETFDASIEQMSRRPLPPDQKFTVGKRYPILREQSLIAGAIPSYVTKDDRGVEVMISSEYFTPIGAGALIGGFERDTGEQKVSSAKLAYQDQYLETKRSTMTANPYEEDLPAELMAMPTIRGR